MKLITVFYFYVTEPLAMDLSSLRQQEFAGHIFLHNYSLGFFLVKFA